MTCGLAKNNKRFLDRALLNDLFLGLISDRIHISSELGKDSQHCGSEEKPCKTIGYAVNLMRTNANLLLHGGSKWNYTIKSPLSLNFSTNIRKHGNAIGNPLIYCMTDKLFKISNKIHFQLKSVNIYGTANELIIISLNNARFLVAMGNITISNVNVTARNNLKIKLVSLDLFQTADIIAISSSHIQGVLINIRSASYICKRNMGNITITHSRAVNGIELKGGEYTFGNIVIKDSIFKKDIVNFQKSKITINRVNIFKTFGENGLIIEKPSTNFNDPDPYSIIPNNELNKVAVIEEEHLPIRLKEFRLHNSKIKNILQTEDMYPDNETIIFDKIQITNSKCDICIVSKSCVINIGSNIIRNSQIKNKLIDVNTGEFAMQEFNFHNNQVQPDSKAIYFESSRNPNETIVLKNGFIEWNVDGNEKPIVDIREAPLRANIVNVTIKTSSQKEFKAILLEEKRREFQGLENVSILCSNGFKYIFTTPHRPKMVFHELDMSAMPIQNIHS